MEPELSTQVSLFKKALGNLAGVIGPRVIQPFMRRQVRRQVTDLSVARQMKASIESAGYADQHMRDAKVFYDADSAAKEVLRYALSKSRTEGMFLEFGVWSGKTINIIAEHTAATIHGFDSFQGLPEDWSAEGGEKGTFDTKGELPSVRQNVRLHVGWFNDTLPNFVRTFSDPISFLHIDCDLYSSTKTIFEHLADRIRTSTIIVFDEYFNYPGWQEHEFKAFREFTALAGKQYRYIAYNSRSNNVVVEIL